MDAYTKNLHLQDKDYDSDIPNNELSPLEGDHRESQSRFSVEEPLEVQLRFDLGSLVDAQVLLDTHGPRESHWDFVRQEQGRFQTSSEDNTALLAHVKQDDLKPFDNCEGWPRSTTQVHTPLFMDTQDDVSMITEAFGGKDRSMTDLAEEGRNLLPPSYRHQEEATEWIGEEGKACEVDNSCRESTVDGSVEASQVTVERLDTTGACETNTKLSPDQLDNIQIQTTGNNENHAAEESAPGLVTEPLLNSECRTAENAASLTVSEPQCQVPCNETEEAIVHQDLPLDCSKQNQADSIQLEASGIDDVEVSVQMAAVIPAEDVNRQSSVSMNAQDSCAMEEESKMAAVETKVEVEPLLVISDSMGKNVEDGHMLSNKADATQETGTALIIQSCDTVSYSSPKLENETPGVISDTVDKQTTFSGTCFDSKRTLQRSEVIAKPDSGEKNKVSELPCHNVECILETSEAAAVRSNSMVENLKCTSPSNNMQVSNDETISGINVALTLRSFKESGNNNETEGEAGEGSDAKQQNIHMLLVEQGDSSLDGDKSVVAVKPPTAEQQVKCLEPALTLHMQDDADISTCAEIHEISSLCNKIERTQGIGTMTDLSKATPDIAPKESNLGAQQARYLSGSPQVSVVHGDADTLNPADYNVQSKDHAANDNVNLGQDGERRSATPTVLTGEDSSLRDEIMNEKIQAQSAGKSSRQDKLPTEVREDLIQELSMKHHDTDQSASDYSISSAKPILLCEGENLTESIHPGGVLHVLIDVHKEGATGNSSLKEGSLQDHVKTIESKENPNVQKLNPGDAMRKDSASVEDVATAVPYTYVSGLTGVTAFAGSQEDEQRASNYSSPPQEKASKRKSDSSTRNNRLKDSARASPLQVRPDKEQKDAGKEGLGKHKSTPKNATPKKGSEPAEVFSSPQKSVSKSSSGRKKGASIPIVQDVMVSSMATDGFQTPAIRNKTGFAVTPTSRQQALPDVNGSEITLPIMLHVQPFTEPQQVQLRAQILVYGSLIQGAAPEEALMVAAFSNVVGAPAREPGRDLDASGRAVWEKQWQGAVERIQAKSSRDTSRDSSRASGILVSNLPVTSSKASEAGLKGNSSSGITTNNVVDVRNVAGLHARVSDIPATKGHPSHPRQSADPGLIIPASRSNQSIAVAVPPGPSTSTAFHSVPSSLSDNLSQSTKARVDLQQATPPAYYPAPPLGSFLAGPPQWLSTATFPGPWIPQTQAGVYNTPTPLFSHPQAIVSSDQAPDMAVARRNTAPSAGPVVPVNSIVPALYTPVVGSMSVTPTPAADIGQKRQLASEARPRKRKKTQSELYGSPTEVVPNAPFMVGISNQVTSVSDLPAGHAGLMMSNPVDLPSLSAPESLAMVVAKMQTPKTVLETSIIAVNANKSSAPDSSNMLNTGSTPQAVEQKLGKPVSLQNSASQLAQAEASAEEAASVAASAVRESESLWSQLKAQKSAGLASDIEMQLVSSAAAMATAASVAKAAAAAARAAYEAAVQAKMFSEDALGSSKQGNEVESFRLLQNKAENASQNWGMPESCNSILAAAKITSRKRLEAASASRARAQNFESVLRAAELATNAVSQVGSVIAMGESLPFTLEMLMEAGPEGLQRLLLLGSPEDKENTNTKGTGPESPGKKGTPKQKGSIEKEKQLSKKSIGVVNKEASMQRETQVDSWTTEGVIPSMSEFDARINANSGVELMTEFSKQNIDDHLALSMPASRQGLPPSRSESGLAMQQEVSIVDDQITKGSLVEVMSNEKGLRGVWFSARVQNVDVGKVFVLYENLLSDDGVSPLEEWIQLKGSPSKAPRVRLAHPISNISFEGTRKRRREAMGNPKWSVGDRVDAWMRDGWWEGEIKEIIEDGESKARVFFPGEGDTSLMKTSKLRPSLVWVNGHWVLWTDAKKGKSEELKGRHDSHEGETPIAKRQKSEKGQLSNTSNQKLVGISTTEIAAAQKEGSLFDSAAIKLPTDFKGFTIDGTDKSKQQGSKVMFGVPRPTKKRKLMEVSKHYNPARGVRSTSTLNVKATDNKYEDVRTAAMGFATGSLDVSRLDSSKAKKRVLPSQKLRITETANSKGNAIRSKKDRPFADSKTLARKNASTREGVSAASKNTEGRVLNKKKLPLEKSQPESEEQTEGFPIIDVSSQKVASLSSAGTLEANNYSSILLEESGKEPSHTAQRSGKSSEKQTLPSAGRESGKDSVHVMQARDNKQTLLKEKSSSQQAKVKSKQLLTPANGNKQSAKKKETQPSDPPKDSKEPVHLSKESQKQSSVLVKESESQPFHEGEKQLSSPVSSVEKQPTSPINNSEKQPKEIEKGKDVGKLGLETWEPRRTSRKIQPTSKLLEGLQTAPKLGKNSSSHDKGSRVASKAAQLQ